MNLRNRTSHSPRRLCLALLSITAWTGTALAQTAPAAEPTNGADQAAASRLTAENTVNPNPAPKEEVLELSPFQVTANNKGYFASNSMSGTRLNSKIEDLGQSISVMTKEQMTDFAMLDINDVFDYMAGAEGTGSYSDFVTDRTGAVTDNVSLDPNNANRVRGIGNANIAFNNIAVSGRVPVDPLWMDSLELSRGPNANIFGLGNSSGTVNQVPATANLTRDFTKAEMRVDSYEGYRTSLDVNRTLIKNMLSVRSSYAYQHTGFIRKPSGEDARRFSLQAKAQPFKNTTVALSWYNYKNKSQRPNYTTPRDFISSWIAAGRPSWNPTTRLITLNGVTYGQGMVAGSTTPITTLPAYFAGNDNRAVFRIGNGTEAPYWSAPSNNTNATSPLLNVASTVRFVQTAAVNAYGAAQPLFATSAALSDKSIYDWEEVNLSAMNKQWDDVNTYLAQVDQVIINTPKHLLAAQATFMREDAEQMQDLPTGAASVNGIQGQLYADPNIVNLDGTPNPYYGRPYLKSSEPFLRDKPLLWDTSRAQAVYRLDFSQDRGLTKWLGTQQLLGYYEYKDQQTRQYTWRLSPTSLDVPWIRALYDAGIPIASRTTTNTRYAIAPGNVGRMFQQYYVGSTPGGGVEYGPSFFPVGATLPLVWGNTGAWNNAPVNVDYTPSPDGAGALSNQQLVIKTKGGVLQSTFLEGKLVTTFGLREDQVFSHNAPFATLTPDLRDYDREASDQWLPGWRVAQGKTKTASVVARPFRDFRFIRTHADSGTGMGKFVAELVGNLSLTYNQSDTFKPQAPAVDLAMQSLPNTTGQSKDIGFWLTLFDGKLSVRYTHFKNDEINIRNGDINTMAQRVLRADGLVSADSHNLQDRSTEWITQLNPTWTTTQIQAEVARTMGLTQAQMDALSAANDAGALAATQDVVSEGDELEVNFNPTRAWTISGSLTKTESINQNAGSSVEDWINLRMPIWNSVEDPRFTQASPGGANIPVGATGHLLWRYIAGTAFTTYGYHATTSAIANYSTFVEGPLAVYRQLEGRPRPQMSKYTAKLNTRYNLSGLTDHRIFKNMSVGGSVRWVDKAAIGFYGVETLPARITALDVNRPVYAEAQTYVDLFLSYNTKLFRDKVRAKFQLNAKNIGEKGGTLRATKVFPDGTPEAYRIIDPRQFILSASFDL